MRTVLSIAGSDPTGGAGLQADLQVIRALGCHAAGVVSALTVQDSQKVHSVLPVFPSVVLDQLRVLLRDFQPNAVKIGMLASDDVVRNVALGLCELDDHVPIVIDPVLHASDGKSLLEHRAWASLCELFARATLVTPNLAEAEALAGGDCSSRQGSEAAARFFIEELGTQAVLLKGGHREGAPDDLLAWREAEGRGIELRWLAGERVDTGGAAVHGTGCALSAAIATALARGDGLEVAVETGRRFVAAGLQHAQAPGKGSRFLVHTSIS